MVKGRKMKMLLLLILQIVVAATAANVTYDHRALVIDGKRKILISGSIHYPRSTPEVLHYYTVYACVSMYVYVSVTGCITNSVCYIYIFFNFGDFFLVWLQMWPDLIQKSKDGGLDVIETYVFWSGHEPEKNKVGSVFGFCFILISFKIEFSLILQFFFGNFAV